MAIPEDRPRPLVQLRVHGDRRGRRSARAAGAFGPGPRPPRGCSLGAAPGVIQTFPLKPFYDICTNAAMAGYCQDGRSYTKNGTLVDLYDTRQIIWPNAIENPFSA